MAEQLGHILKGAKVYISKKVDMVCFILHSFILHLFYLLVLIHVQKIQTQLHDLISKIGGCPTWMYDNSVTHYIHG